MPQSKVSTSSSLPSRFVDYALAVIVIAALAASGALFWGIVGP